MQILINSKNEIISFAIVGGFENGVEVDNIPENFIINFKPKYYLYSEGEIEVNKNFEEEIGIGTPIAPPTPNIPGTDEELRVMFANMQVQVIEANSMINEISSQNARLAQEIIDFKKDIEKLKELK